MPKSQPPRRSKADHIVHLIQHLYEATVSVHRRLASILTRIRALEAQGRVVLMATEELKAMLERINVATNNIAEDVRRLTAAATQPGGLTAEQAADVQAQGDEIATRLEGIAASTEDPIPEEPPVDPPVDPPSESRRRR